MQLKRARVSNSSSSAKFCYNVFLFLVLSFVVCIFVMYFYWMVRLDWLEKEKIREYASAEIELLRRKQQHDVLGAQSTAVVTMDNEDDAEEALLFLSAIDVAGLTQLLSTNSLPVNGSAVKANSKMLEALGRNKVISETQKKRLSKAFADFWMQPSAVKKYAYYGKSHLFVTPLDFKPSYYSSGDLYHRPLDGAHPELGILHGDWRVFHDSLILGKNGRDCLVYSFGIHREWNFDDHVAKYLNCEVHSFDPMVCCLNCCSCWFTTLIV